MLRYLLILGRMTVQKNAWTSFFGALFFMKRDMIIKCAPHCSDYFSLAFKKVLGCQIEKKKFPSIAISISMIRVHNTWIQCVKCHQVKNVTNVHHITQGQLHMILLSPFYTDMVCHMNWSKIFGILSCCQEYCKKLITYSTSTCMSTRFLLKNPQVKCNLKKYFPRISNKGKEHTREINHMFLILKTQRK